jgi:hypothetical protein
MKPVLMLAALIALAAASAPGRSTHEALMDEIERQVRLPAEARPLDEYGRYYFFEGKGRVRALFVHALDPRDDGSSPSHLGCAEGVTIRGRPALRAIPCPADPAARRYLRAGHRQWVAGRSAAPAIHDGGCKVVHLTFDLRTRKAGHVSCNGHA